MRKIIKASAGTGKTYSLSLEFINILLSYPEISFDEIVVITFTKKATAEIRERIFSHLKSITNDFSEDNPILKSLLKMNPNIKQKQVVKIYENLVINKDKIRITTIDSFINSVFRTVIAPYLNIADYEIDPDINDKYLPLIFRYILNSPNKEKFEKVFKNFKAKSMEKFSEFIKTIIDRRWVFDFANKADYINADKNVYWNDFIKNLTSAFQTLVAYLKFEGITVLDKKSGKLNKDFWDFMQNNSAINRDELVSIVVNRFETLKEQNRLSDVKIEKFIASGRKKNFEDFKLEIADYLQKAKQIYIDYLFLTLFKDEHIAIVNLSNEILKYYDEIKFSKKIFTYSDISYYTFKYLYTQVVQADASILELFYEKLAYKTRFILIDEFQDTSIIQWNILNPIIQEIISGSGQKEYGGVVIVGDEKQAIYGWRGGERELLIKSDEFLPFANYFTLDTSYRSGKVIVDFINSLFLDFDENWSYRNMLSIKEGGFVKVQITNLKMAELATYDYYEMIIKNELLPLIDKINLSETAIIARTNSELEVIALVLKKYGINYILESSSGLSDINLIKSILALLNFIAKCDYQALLVFLRSDVILITPQKIMEIFAIFKENNTATVEEFFNFNKDDKIISTIKEIYKLSPELSVSQIVGKILNDFAYLQVYTNDIDYINLDYFLNIIDDFENNNSQYKSDLSGFLEYFYENEVKFQQKQLENSNLIKLITIHKSKGLGFENVFFFGKLVKRNARSFHSLHTYFRFNSDYSGFKEFYTTLNFTSLIKKTDFTDIENYFNLREYYEEINALYVALTRVKQNLFVFLDYSLKQKIENVFDAYPEQPTVNLFKKFFRNNQFHEKDYMATYQTGEIKFSKNAEQKNIFYDYSKLKQFLAFNQTQKAFVEINESNFTKFVKKPSAIIGTMAHYYLSFIKLDFEKEKQFALKQTISKYGAILLNEPKAIIKKVDEFILRNMEYFSKKNWDKVLCEYSIFDEEGREYRIDRLLIKDDKILIIDYKTGEQYDKKQLEVYKKIVSKLYPDYKVETKYLEISI